MRAAGYFTSQSLALVAAGLPTFIAHEGTFRLIASPYLSTDDVIALRRGVVAQNDIVERALLDAFEDSDKDEIVRHRLGFLAWLVASGRMEIRIALPVGDDGLYHEKYGIFVDEFGQSVAFTGSPNETRGGLESNFESIDVFASWSPEGFRVDLKRTAFETAWANEMPGLTTVPLPEAVKQRLLRMRPPTAPDRDPLEPPAELDRRVAGITLPDPRPYQEEAVLSWVKAGYRGIFEMATGTGKTITALLGATQYIGQAEQAAVVVAAPYKHLVDQWDGEMRAFDLKPILCYENSREWSRRLRQATSDLRIGIRSVLTCVATHDALRSAEFQSWFASLHGVKTLLIGDEVHNLGSARAMDALELMDFDARLGLSATPRRWSDDETQAVFDYFGDVVYDFPLDRAIREGYLVPYTYHPHLVELDDEEMTEYVDISRQLARFGFGPSSSRDIGLEEFRGHLLRRRAGVLNNAIGKMGMLAELLAPIKRPRYTLVYTTPERLDEAVGIAAAGGRRMVHRFTYRETTKERKRLLSLFAKGEIGMLVAIRCLDEGVDIPKTETAHILASSGNSREFIQRRGRILRRAEGKDRAVIHDFLAVPSSAFGDEGTWKFERQIVRRELARFREFASMASNQFSAEQELLPLQQRYGLFDA